jgi:hypothetical protein
MGLFDKIFGKKKTFQPEENFVITITDEIVKIEHPKRKTEMVKWNDIKEIIMLNTDDGPWLPDVWMGLIGDEGGCLIPLGAKGYDDVFDIVSKYEGFDFESYIKSATCTENAQFLVWKKK